MSDIPKNVLAINEDLIHQLERAPIDLATTFRKDGFGGATKFVERFKDLVDLVLRVHDFGLLLLETRIFALDTCIVLLRYRIPVSGLWLEADRLRRVLQPEHFYFDQV